MSRSHLLSDTTPEPRRRIMRAIKSQDTAPELLVRRLAHRLGYRFRIQGRNLPGKPDLVFPRKRKVIFVHGCFWHSQPTYSRTKWIWCWSIGIWAAIFMEKTRLKRYGIRCDIKM